MPKLVVAERDAQPSLAPDGLRPPVKQKLGCIIRIVPMSTTLYEVLGVSRSASESEITAACLRLGEQFRPDKNADPVAKARFLEIEKAYQVLIDPTRRAKYDRSLSAVVGIAAPIPNYPVSVMTRVVYALALLLFAIPVIAQVQYALVLFRQMPSNPNVVNPITATITLFIALLVAAVVLYRIVGLIRGQFRLASCTRDGWLHYLRMFSLFLIYAGVFVLLASLLAHYLTGISAVLLIAGEFRNLAPVGLVLFEFARLIERELVEQRNAT
jgi:hypothetical protein